MTSSTSAAADPFEQPTPENIRRYAKLMVERINDDSWIRSYSERLLGIANNLEAQQTDDTLSGLKKEIEGERKTIRELGTELLATDRWGTIRAIGEALAHWKDDSAKAKGKE